MRSCAIATLSAAGQTRAVRARNASAAAGTFSNSVVAALASAAGPMKDFAQAGATLGQIDQGQPGALNGLINAIQPNAMPQSAPLAS